MSVGGFNTGSLIMRAAFGVAALAIALQSAASEPLACYARSAKSKQSVDTVAMRIVNNTTVPAQIVWIDFQSHQKPYFELPAGKSQVQQTYATHPWIAASSTGECMCGHIAEADANGRDEWVLEPFEPTASYTKRIYAGFTVNVSAKLIADTALHDPSVKHVEQMVSDMAAKLPRPAVAGLQKASALWLEHSDCRKPAGEYHPSRGWLMANNVNPDKAKNVEFNADHLHWSKEQPAMMLHEFAHAFHDIYLRGDNPEVLRAFARACRDGKYENVDYVLGGKKRAYALNNQMEFFAELSEAYFWRNDFEPYDRTALAKFDPESMAMIERMWRAPLGAPNTGDTGDAMSCAEAMKLAQN